MVKRGPGSRRYSRGVTGAGALTMIVASSLMLLTDSKWWFVGTLAGGALVLIGLIRLARDSASR